MIDAGAELSISKQARILGISRGAVYYQPSPVSDADLKPDASGNPRPWRFCVIH